MDNVLRQIEIDLYSTTSYEVIKAQQGDKNSRVIEFILYNQGEPYLFDNDVFFRFVGHRGDGSSFSKTEEECIVRINNHVRVTLLEDILYYDGIIEAKLVMYKELYDSVGNAIPDSQKVLSTIPFKISCIKNPCNENNLSKGELSIVTDLIFQMKNFSKGAQDIIDAAAESAANAKASENNAKTSEDKAKTSEVNAKNSETNAINCVSAAKMSENNAKTSEEAAKTSSTNADTYAKKSQSYAVGTGNVRPNESTDSAKYYYEQSKNIYDNFSSAGNVTGVKGNAESSYRTGNVNITPENIGLGNVNNTADSAKNVSSAKLLAVQENNYRQGTDLPSTYPRGETVFLSDNPTNKFNGILFCTIHTIKGYTNMACIQFLYPYNTNHDKIYFREALYNSDSWRPWYELITSANIGSQSVSYATSAGSATKATQDGSGNVITDTYAKKSIYGDNAISLGRKAGSTTGGKSFACGSTTTASGEESHAEGFYTTASGDDSHAEGIHTTASGTNSHAEGSTTTASGTNSHAEGFYTIASNYASHACGKYNKLMTTGGNEGTQAGDVFVVGNGSSSSRSNAIRITYTGDILGTKAFQSSGADYAEHFEKKTGIGEDWVGHFVTIKDGYIYKANEGDYILGIVSGNPSIIGNSDEDYYWRYERDEFNRIVMEDVPELIQKTDEDGNLVFDEETHEPIMIETGNIVPNARMKLSEGYDPTLQDTYIPREKRDEWECVGMLGVIPVRDDGTCLPNHFCKCGTGGIATFAEGRGIDTFFVIERISDNVVSVILK